MIGKPNPGNLTAKDAEDAERRQAQAGVKQVLRFAQDFGSRLRRLLNALSLERSDKIKDQ